VTSDSWRSDTTDLWWLTSRYIRWHLSHPGYLTMNLIQPAVWLFFFGGLFRGLAAPVGLDSGGYLGYLVPGVVIMTALSGSLWTGLNLLGEAQQGILDRFLVTPVRRSVLLYSSLVAQATISSAQALVILGMGRLGGARYPGGLLGIAALVLVTAGLSAMIGGLSHAFALLARKQPTVIVLNNSLFLPMTFLSTAFTAASLMPRWMASLARFNPMNWALSLGRAALTGFFSWQSVFLHAACLLGLTVLALWLTLRALLIYQKVV
jgi:ABC-2 type transport system permease protein